MKAIFYDRNNDLVRCQFAGMNEKGRPDWMVIEQGKATQTLAEIEKAEHRNLHYRLLCLEGEEVNRLTLMRIMCSFIRGEIEGYSSMNNDIDRFTADMIKHQVDWNKKSIALHFRISPEYKNEGKYYLSIKQDIGGSFLGFLENITDLDKLLEVLDNFCCSLEDEVNLERVYSILDISSVDDYEFSEVLMGRFSEVIKIKD